MTLISFLHIGVFKTQRNMHRNKRICAGFYIVCVYMNCRWRSSYQEKGESPLTVLSPPHSVSVQSKDDLI